MSEYSQFWCSAQLQKLNSLKTTLEGNGFNAHVTGDAKEAAQKVLSLIPEGASVGLPGTVSVRELGVDEALRVRGNEVIAHWGVTATPEERKKIFARQICADVFLTGTNALTLDGCLVNIDGTGNRVAGMSWGPGRLIVVASAKKICNSLAEAIMRVKNEACGPNALRLGNDTPCAALGYCENCDSPSRMCRIISIIERAPLGRDVHIVLTLADVGF